MSMFGEGTLTRIIGKTDIGRIHISTVIVPLSNMCETCIFEGDSSEVVEVYPTVADAKTGHAKWMNNVRDGWRIDQPPPTHPTPPAILQPTSCPPIATFYNRRRERWVVATDDWNSLTPYVVWWADSDGHCYHGDYFRTESAMIEEFNKRSIQS